MKRVVWGRDKDKGKTLKSKKREGNRSDERREKKRGEKDRGFDNVSAKRRMSDKKNFKSLMFFIRRNQTF